MLLLLPFLCFLSSPVRGNYEGTCLQRAPPPGVLVVSSGSNLVLTCSGDVKVNGVKVNVSHRNLHERPTPPTAQTISATTSSDHTLIHSTSTESKIVREGSRHKLTTQTPNLSRLVKAGELLDENNRETRGIDVMPAWKWNGKKIGTGHTRQDGVLLKDEGSSLVLSSVRFNDSGNFTCHHRGRKLFGVKVIIADPPETPTLSCYKKSPSSRIVCEWSPQNRSSVRPNCSLWLTKSRSQPFQPHRCSYWARTSRCDCALGHNGDELRLHHYAYLCVTNIAGSVVSPILSFIPFNILKPDPPSSVSTQPEEGHPTRIKVSWGLPVSWRREDNFYNVIYEVKYRLEKSSYEQVKELKEERSFTIMDAAPGMTYLIQVRTKEEYDGQWSGWSSPVKASSWKAPPEVHTHDDLFSTLPPYEDYGGSGSAVDTIDELFKPDEAAVSHHIVWISISFLVLSLIVVAYMYRNRERFLLKLHSLAALRQFGRSSRPPATPKECALVTPPTFKEPQLDEEEDEEEQTMIERTEAIHFNNTSYFVIKGSEEKC